MARSMMRRWQVKATQADVQLCVGLGPHGRAPVSFFAVEPGLAVGLDAAAPARELRQLVAGLHAAGLSVLCQVRQPPRSFSH